MMFPGSLWRGFLVTSILVCFACSDLRLRRSTEGAVADTTPESSTTAKRSSRSRQKDSALNSGSNESSFAAIRRSLRRLVVAEETFFAENGTYSDELSLIGVSPDQNTTIRFLWLSRDGWAASGVHSDIPGRDCVVFVGQAKAPPTTLKYVRSGREGVPVCDDAPVRSKPAAAPPPAQPRPAPVDTGSALDLLDPRVVMKVDLRNLARSQETYFAMQGIYARRTEGMALQYLWHRHVRVNILAADGQSWAAKATHARFPGKSCVVWYGAVAQRPQTDAQQRQANRPGEPVCDD